MHEFYKIANNIILDSKVDEIRESNIVKFINTKIYHVINVTTFRNQLLFIRNVVNVRNKWILMTNFIVRRAIAFVLVVQYGNKHFSF